MAVRREASWSSQCMGRVSSMAVSFKRRALAPAVRLGLLLLAGGALLAGWSATCAAEFIQPVGVAVSSYYNVQQHPLNLINGAGIVAPVTSASTHVANTNAASMWHAGMGYSPASGDPPLVAEQWLKFTLPGAYDLSEAYIWQMNQSNNLGRGVNEFEMFVSSNGANWTPVAVADSTTLQLQQATGVASGAQTVGLQNGVYNNVRFVRFDIKSSHNGSASDYVGLSEVRFEGTQVASGPKLTITQGPDASVFFGGDGAPSSNDLLQGKLASSSLSTGGGPSSLLTDGVAIATGLGTSHVWAQPNTAPWELVYDAAALGLASDETIDVSKINVFAYSGDWRRRVDFDVLYTIDGDNWEYLFMGAQHPGEFLGSVHSITGNAITLSSLAMDDPQANMLEGVRGLRFDFRPVQGTNGHSGLIEIDVIGQVIPEPSTGGFVLAGALGLLGLRRRGQRR